jgi:hypothetical protein
MKKLAILLFAAVLFSSCSQQEFLTGSILATVKGSNIPLEKIQFFNDNGLVLERELSSSDANVKAGVLVIKNGKSINRITLDKQTPGALVKVDGEKLLVSFDEGAKESNSLTFLPVAGENGDSYYQLVDDSGNTSFSRLNFDGNKYLVYSLSNKFDVSSKAVTKPPRVRLKIMKSSLNGLIVNSKRMKGNRVQ